MLLSLLPTAVFAATPKAKLVADASELKAGDQIILTATANSKTYVAGSLSGKYLTSIETDPADPAANVEVFTLGGKAGAWTLTASDGKQIYTAAAKALNNAGKGTGTWTISIDANGLATVASTDTNYGRILYNVNSPRFMNYTSATNATMLLPSIYRLEVSSARQSGVIALENIQDGDKVVIFNPANGKALSTDYAGGFYNQATDVTLTDGKLTGYTDADLWTITKNTDGTYTIATADGKKLSMDTGYTSTPLDKANNAWKVTAVAGKDATYYIDNATRTDKYRLQYYATNKNWSAYTGTGAAFEQQLYLVVDDGGSDQPSAGLPKPGDQVVIYNQNAQAVLAAQNDNATSPAINKAAATIKDGKAACANGAAVFTVEKSGDYYRFYNKTYGYLCANGTGNNAFYSATAGDDADWLLRTCSGGVGGYEMESRTAKYKGHSQWLEYYSDSFKVYSMYNVTDYTIYSFSFYPVGPGTISDGVVNNPAVILGDLPDAYVGTDYAFPFTVDAPFGVRGDMTAKLNGTSLSVTKGEDGTYTVTIPAASVTGDKLTVNISGADNKYIPIFAAAEITVKDEPVLADPTPARGSQTGENKRPTISVTLDNAGQNPTVTMTVGGKTVTPTYESGRVTYTPRCRPA